MRLINLSRITRGGWAGKKQHLMRTIASRSYRDNKTRKTGGRLVIKHDGWLSRSITSVYELFIIHVGFFYGLNIFFSRRVSLCERQIFLICDVISGCLFRAWPFILLAACQPCKHGLSWQCPFWRMYVVVD